eukprot:TRINITY_DN6770_c0_g1_i1.p1 TRINITY_DN6770_c0_g1~~TRINITY_DN6770_c0_g1_i1.p1  ORF type:complete len:214 (+),score=14.77 TRINITY_DN6770_c0_g1_i1:230-871(+)
MASLRISLLLVALAAAPAVGKFANRVLPNPPQNNGHSRNCVGGGDGSWTANSSIAVSQDFGGEWFLGYYTECGDVKNDRFFLFWGNQSVTSAANSPMGEYFYKESPNQKNYTAVIWFNGYCTKSYVPFFSWSYCFGPGTSYPNRAGQTTYGPTSATAEIWTGDLGIAYVDTRRNYPVAWFSPKPALAGSFYGDFRAGEVWPNSYFTVPSYCPK